MSENDENSMIGYDPLAWMQEGETQEFRQAESEAAPVLEEQAVVETAVASVVEQEPSEAYGDILQQEAFSLAAEEAPDAVDEAQANQQPEFDDEPVESTYSSETPTPEAQVQQVVLEAVQSIQNVNRLYEQVLLALSHGSRIDIDASAVTMIDTATLQLLLILKQTALAQHKEVVIDFPSDRFLEAAGLLGLSEMLSVDQAVSGFF